jgi:hypothetical protein
MDAIVGVWLSSLLGATAFSAAGYVLGQRGAVLPFLGLTEAARKAGARPPNVDQHTVPSEQAPESSPAAKSVAPPASLAAAIPGEQPSDDDEDRPTIIPDTMTQAAVMASAIATLPPPRSPSMGIDMLELETTKADLEAALSKADAAAQRARAAEALKLELERQIETLRAELRNEVVARATASAHADELGDRLASASEEASSLRHKVSLLDRQAKQLREALQGRVRALTTSEWHRRRDHEETEEMRLKLRDVYEKLERTSLPPPSSTSLLPSPPDMSSSLTSPGMPAASQSMREQGEEGTLRAEIARLTKENRDLRARALGSSPPKRPSRGSAPDLDLDAYRELVARLGGIAGLKGAVLADEIGSVLVGEGDLAEGMAAFGAFIKDASSRTDRLLPLEGVEEVDIRDRRGVQLSTRVIAQTPSELCVVLLGAADASLAAAKKVVEDHLRLRATYSATQLR